jgi:hypothetical protein
LLEKFDNRRAQPSLDHLTAFGAQWRYITLRSENPSSAFS